MKAIAALKPTIQIIRSRWMFNGYVLHVTGKRGWSMLKASDVEALPRWWAPNATPSVAAGVYGDVCIRLSDVLALLAAQPDSWRCFHCDEVFTDKDEAREHFGAEMYRDAACRLPVGADIQHIRGLELRCAELQRDNDRLDNDARLWQESEADRVRRIGNCQWWQEKDSLEGEIIALKEQLVEAKGSAPTPSAWQPIGPAGRWICQTCGFQLTKAFLRAHDGAVGVDARPVHDVCPNDGTSMRPITWEEDAADANRVGLEQMKRADRFERALESIAASSCCSGCQEAALVAKAVLRPLPPPPPERAR